MKTVWSGKRVFESYGMTLGLVATGALVLTATVAVVVTLLNGRTVSPASAQETIPLRVTVDKDIYVVGVDPGIRFAGQIAACAGQDLKVGFYSRGPASKENSLLAVPPAAVTRADSTGAFDLEVLLPTSGIDPVTTWAGVSGACLDTPRFASETIHIGVSDSAANPGGATSLFIASWVLADTGTSPGGTTLAERIGSLTVFADGVECTRASLTSATVVDKRGNARIRVGGANQPAACARSGAMLTVFRDDNGLQLVELRSVVPGVTQPLANMAPFPAGAGGQVLPPMTGPTKDSPGHRTLVAWRVALLLVGSAGLVGVTWRLARRR